MPLTKFKQDITRKATLLTRAQKGLQALKPPLNPAVGKFTQSIDGVIQETTPICYIISYVKSKQDFWHNYGLESLD